MSSTNIITDCENDEEKRNAMVDNFIAANTPLKKNWKRQKISAMIKSRAVKRTHGFSVDTMKIMNVIKTDEPTAAKKIMTLRRCLQNYF